MDNYYLCLGAFTFFKKTEGSNQNIQSILMQR